ncbi:MAG TPA: hypothetical protein VML75_12750 [Kofleriaceae bacterium]|nr:hypothetical protein [Kofleriaceae bacterium]
MLLELILNRATIEGFLHQAAPIRIHLGGGDRWVELDAPASVEMVPEYGAVRIVTSGRVYDEVQDLQPELEVHRLVLFVEPRLIQGEGGLRLLLPVTLEGAHFPHAPACLDASLSSLVSAALRPSTELMMWRFGAGLSRELPLPASLQPLEAMGIEPVEAELTIGAESLTLRITLDTTVSQADLAASPGGAWTVS